MQIATVTQDIEAGPLPWPTSETRNDSAAQIPQIDENDESPILDDASLNIDPSLYGDLPPLGGSCGCRLLVVAFQYERST